MSVTTSAHPAGQSVDIALRDGSSARIRPVLEQDRDAIRAFLGSLSSESIGFRFFGAANLEWASGWSVDIDYGDRYGLVATAGPVQAIVAHAAYVRAEADRAGWRSWSPTRLRDLASPRSCSRTWRRLRRPTGSRCSRRRCCPTTTA